MPARLLALAALACLSAGRASSMHLYHTPSAHAQAVCAGSAVAAHDRGLSDHGSGQAIAFAGVASPAGGLLARTAIGATCNKGAAPVLGRLPMAALRGRSSRNSALTTVCVFKEMTKGLGDLFGKNNNDVDALKKMLVRCCPCCCPCCVPAAAAPASACC